MSKHTCESVLGCNNRACPVHYPATQPDHDAFLAGPVEAKPAAYPKDQRIAELESELLEMARTQAAGLAREEKLFKELGDARAECERQREYHEAAFRIVERDTATIRRLEAAAGRMQVQLDANVKAKWELARQWYARGKALQICQKAILAIRDRVALKSPMYELSHDAKVACENALALTESDAGTRALAVIEAARNAWDGWAKGDNVVGPMQAMRAALANWDQGAKPSGGKGDAK